MVVFYRDDIKKFIWVTVIIESYTHDIVPYFNLIIFKYFIIYINFFLYNK